MDGDLTLDDICKDRMRHEGTLQKWRARYEELRRGGLDYNKARWQSLKEFGYISPKDEREKYEERMRTKGTPVIIPDRVPPQRERAAFDEALAALSTETVEPKVEINWIRNHPAMCRKKRQKDTTEPVRLTAEDIADAPCRAAAIQLQNWADNPTEASKQFASLIKKMDAEESEKKTDFIADPNLDDVERMLKEAARADTATN